jgi:hypothetical protein
MKVDSDPATGPNTQLLFPLLKGFLTTFVEGSHPRSVADKLFQGIVGSVLERCQDTLAALLLPTQDKDTYRSLEVLVDLINIFGDNLFSGTNQVEVRFLFLTIRHLV